MPSLSIVFIVSFYTALTYELSYLILITITEVIESSYGFGQGLVGFSFLGRGNSYNLRAKDGDAYDS